MFFLKHMSSIMKYQLTPTASVIQFKPDAFFKMHLEYTKLAGSLPFEGKQKDV